MDIEGLGRRSEAQVFDEVRQGAKFVVFEYCISILIMTFKRSSKVYYIPPGQSAFLSGLPYTLISVLLGWWGFPWGLIYTPASIITNTFGGKDVTTHFAPAIRPVRVMQPAVEVSRR